MPTSGVPGGLQAQALIPLITDPFSIIKGTHSDIGPLKYLYTNWAFVTAPEYNTIAGDELFIYHPMNHPAILPKERLIAYNVRSGYWRDWHLENEPDMLSQLSASGAVSAWVGGERYFAFVSPYPITANTPPPVNQTSATGPTVETPNTAVAVVSSITLTGGEFYPASELRYVPSVSTSTLLVYDAFTIATGTIISAGAFSIAYNLDTPGWEDHGTSVPYEIKLENGGAIVKGFSNEADYIDWFVFNNPY